MKRTRVHHAARRSGGCVAARREGPAAGDPGGRVSGSRITRSDRRLSVAALLQALPDTGHVENKNVIIVYR